MATLTISVELRDAMIARVVSAANNGIATQTERITFETPELLFKTLTPMRVQIIRQMTGAGPMSIRELARRLDQEQEKVHEDVHALLNVGVLDRAGDGAVDQVGLDRRVIGVELPRHLVDEVAALRDGQRHDAGAFVDEPVGQRQQAAAWRRRSAFRRISSSTRRATS